MSLKAKIIIGLADEEIGSRVANVIGGISATDDGKLGFYNAAPVVRQQCTTNTVTALHATLSALGLVNSTIG